MQRKMADARAKLRSGAKVDQVRQYASRIERIRRLTGLQFRGKPFHHLANCLIAALEAR